MQAKMILLTGATICGLFAVPARAQSVIKTTCVPSYSGPLVVEALPDGRRLRLVQPYAFNDSRCLKWQVPEKAMVDGASIPRAAFSLVGGAFDGAYRNASVIHDWYCITRTKPWQAVHRMFYDAMLASGVNKTKAKMMYLAVYYGGPRWDDMTSANAQLAYRTSSATPSVSSSREGGILPALPSGIASSVKPNIVVEQDFNFDETTFKNMAAIVEKNDLEPEQIERLAIAVRPAKQLPPVIMAANPSGYQQTLADYQAALGSWRAAAGLPTQDGAQAASANEP